LPKPDKIAGQIESGLTEVYCRYKRLLRAHTFLIVQNLMAKHFLGKRLPTQTLVEVSLYQFIRRVKEMFGRF